MPIGLTAAITTAFAVHGTDATYTPAATGTPAAVRVVGPQAGVQEGVLFDTGVVSTGLSALVRVSEVAAPEEGDILAVDGASYTVRSFSRGGRRLIWRLGLQEA